MAVFRPDSTRLSIFAAAALLAAAIGASTPCLGRDLYVSNLFGDDRLSGIEPKVRGDDGPVRTIGRALAIARPSDRILVANTGTPYREALAISGPCLHGTSQRPLVLQSDGAVIDGTVVAQAGAWRLVGEDTFAFQPRRLTFQQLFKDGQPLPRVGAGALAETGELPPLHWSLAGSAVRLHVEAGKLPRDYDLRHAGVQTGLTLYNTRHVVVDGFVFQGFQQDGVNAHELVRDCTLRNIECRANGRSGLSVGGSSRVGVENGKFYDNGRVQVRTEGVAKLALTGSDVDRAAGPGYSHGGRSLTVDGAPILQR